ncbi:uncharacterized protein LOC119436666 isoform X4 [Dermacentor silvarum]|uniref:uncharacterized protein LOC119436666 isoform X2 n=1 Tax=Dermacentor silvarum TaxID=543639 RepID=UPI002100C077|nr:uncharacterized protein LOC119436666 isoform X2 [Dermacentor silvarum]XP_049515509.1 uncharacterized protein LOC119436666 isoform X3 [Dermacentor silvarum]XP_049515512.1 uncharacterized protein LOC119436666 isoform X4 [Dermacentor silvarum]
MEGLRAPRSHSDTCCMQSAPVHANSRSNSGTSSVQESDKCRSETWHQSSGICDGRHVSFAKEPNSEPNAHCRRTSHSVDDLGDLQTAREAEKKSLLQQPREKFETVADMTDKFVRYFTTMHLERECTAGVYLCTVCLSAQRTLVKIREAVRKDPPGRRIALNNGKFMKLLVKLCKLESRGPPSICTVTDREMTNFYETQAYRKLAGTVSILEDEQSEELWKCMLGQAAKSIKPLTYTISCQSACIPGGSTCMWDKDCYQEPPQDMLIGQPKAVRKVNPFPVSDLKTLDVIRCVDARHLIVYRGANGKASVDTLNLLLAEFHQGLTSAPREDPPNAGDIVGLFVSSDRLLRMLVVEVTEDMAVVWSMDEGHFCKLRWSNLIDVLPSFRCLPPAVGLAVLSDVHAAPSLKLLRECVRTFQTVTDHSGQEGCCSLEASFHVAMVTRVKDYGAIEVLSSLLHCPDFDTRMITATFLTRLCCRHIGRQAVSKAGGVDKVLGRLRKLVDRRRQRSNYTMITEEKLILVNLLQSMFFRNEELCLDYADSDHIALLSKIQEGLSPACKLYEEVEYCLRTLLGPAYNKCRLPAQVTWVAMTPEKLKNENLSDEPSVGLQYYNEKNAAGRFYRRDSLVPFRSDETHELRPVCDMRKASTRTLTKVACSFLNSSKPCTVYYGISREGLVHGVMLNRRERDALRLGVDMMERDLRPRPMLESIGIEFVPVLRTPTDSRETASCFVVEVMVRGAPDTLYTTSDGRCYLRDGDMTYQATTQDVRTRIVQQEEARYLQAPNTTTSLSPLPTDVSQPSLQPWHRVVY